MDKYVGEMDVEDLEETILNPENRVLKQITISNEAETDSLFNVLMGDSAAARKTFIEKHSKEIEVFI